VDYKEWRDGKLENDPELRQMVEEERAALEAAPVVAFAACDECRARMRWGLPRWRWNHGGCHYIPRALFELEDAKTIKAIKKGRHWVYVQVRTIEVSITRTKQ